MRGRRLAFLLGSTGAAIAVALSIALALGASRAVVLSLTLLTGVLGWVANLLLARAEHTRARRSWAENLRVPLTGGGELPMVGDVGPGDVGVHQTQAGLGVDAGVYVERDLDPELRAALAEVPFVLVVGGTWEGKTRTALEAARRQCPGSRLLAPKPRAGVFSTLLDDPPVSLEGDPILLWLDDLDEYLPEAGGGFDLAMLRRFAGRRPPVTVLATLRTDRLEALLGQAGPVARAMRELHGQVQSRQARELRLPSPPSQREVTAARESFPSSRLRFTSGIGAELVGATTLEQSWDYGKVGNPVGWQIVRAAVDWSLAGCRRPLLEADLPRLLRAYRAGPEAPDPWAGGDLTDGLEWACGRRHSRVALVEKVEGQPPAYRAADYLVARERARHPAGDAQPRIPDELWAVALEGATAEEALAIGAAAWDRRATATAEQAWRKASTASDEETTAMAWTRLAELFAAAGDVDQARAAYQAVIDQGRRDLWPGAAFRLGVFLNKHGRPEEAIEPLRRAVGSQHATVAPEAALYLGTVLVANFPQERSEARSAFAAAVESHDPAVAPRAALRLGDLLQDREEDWQLAREAYEQAMAYQDAPEAATAALHLAELYRDWGQPAEAERLCRQLSESGNNEVEIRAAALLSELRKGGAGRQGDLPTRSYDEGDSLVGRDLNLVATRVDDRSVLTAPFALPPDVQTFTGRQSQLAQLRRLFADAGMTQTTPFTMASVLGEPGVGKSALVVHVAHQLRARFDETLYVNLRKPEGFLEPHELLANLLRAFGVRGSAIPDGLEDRARIYRQRLEDRRVLFILDNVRDESQVRPLLPNKPGCAALITTRVKLSGLSGQVLDLGALDLREAVELLTRVAGPEPFAAGDSAYDALAERCGRLPLALRIVGAQLALAPARPARELVGQLDKKLDQPMEVEQGYPQVRAAVALAYDRMDDLTRRAFRYLGGMRLPDFVPWVAARALDCTVPKARDVLKDLVRAELLGITVEDPTGQVRYRFHDVLRGLAKELRSADQQGAVRGATARVVAGYLSLATIASSALEPGRGAAEADEVEYGVPDRDRELAKSVRNNHLGWFTIERENLIIAVEEGCRIPRSEAGWRLAESLTPFFDVRCHWDDWHDTHKRALQAAQRDGSERGVAVTRRNLGRVYRFQNRWQDAISCYNECLPLFKEVDDRRGYADTLLLLGDVLRYEGAYPEAIQRFKECKEIFEEIDDQRSLAITLRSMGNAYRGPGEYQAAIDCYAQALNLFHGIRDTRWEAATRLSLGDVIWDQACAAGPPPDEEKLQLAQRYFEDSRGVFESINDRHWYALALRSLADVQRVRRRFDEAKRNLERAHRLFEEQGDRHWKACTMRNLGEVAFDLGDLDKAQDLYEQALPVFREVGDRLWEAKTLKGLGLVHRVRGENERAKEEWDKAVALFRELKAPEEREVDALLRDV